jgi:ketosteroid isomerase-like protein
MRNWLITACALLVVPGAAIGQQPAAQGKENPGKQSKSASAQPSLKDLLESKIRIEWTAFKNRDTKAYSDLLADDFVAVETDGEGERNKLHAVRGVSNGLVNDFLLTGFKVLPLGTDAAFVIYECSIKFYPKATIRFLRVYVSELWVKRDGQWKARHYQETRVK